MTLHTSNSVLTNQHLQFSVMFLSIGLEINKMMMMIQIEDLKILDITCYIKCLNPVPTCMYLMSES